MRDKTTEAAVSELEAHGCSISYPVPLHDNSKLTVDGEEASMPIACKCPCSLSSLYTSKVGNN